MTVAGDALLLARGDRVVRNARDARVSLQHTVAVALLTGAAGLDEYAPAMAADPAVAALRTRVVPVLDAALPKGAARVEVRLADGRVLAKTVLDARGSLASPLTDAEIADKVRALSRRSPWRGDVEAAIDLVWRLDEVAEAATLCRLLAEPGP